MLIKMINNHKRLTAVLLLLMVAAVSVFATGTAPDTGDMDTRVYAIVDFFNGGWVKGICCILLIGECLGLLFAGGQNPQIFKKFLPFIVGTVLFMCAGKITNIIWGTNSSTYSKDLDGTSMLIETPIPTMTPPPEIIEFENTYLG